MSLKRSLRSLVGTRLGALALMLVGWVPALGQLQPPANAPSQGEHQAIKALAPYLATAGDPAGKHLQQLGYDHPGIPDAVWRSFTPQGKIETAYLSAEAGSKGSGERMLALLSKSLAQEYEPVAHDPALKDYVKQGGDDAPLTFAKLDPEPTRDRPSGELTLEARKVVEAVSKYCEGGEFGLRTVLTEDLRLDANKAGEILRTSRTHEQVLERGFLAAKPDLRDAGMRRLVSRLDFEYESARSLNELNPWRSSPVGIHQKSPAPTFRWERSIDSGREFERLRNESSRIRLPEIAPDPIHPPTPRSPFEAADPVFPNRAAVPTERLGPSLERPVPRGSPRSGLMERGSRGAGRVVGILILINFCLENPGLVLICGGFVFVCLVLRLMFPEQPEGTPKDGSQGKPRETGGPQP